MSEPRTVTLAYESDTVQFGTEIAARLSAGDLVILVGPLGAGKTALARGIGAGLGVVGRITSPTFVIAREHKPGVRGGDKAPVALVHVDAYRLGMTGFSARDELDALDLDTDLESAVVVVEWGEGLVETLTDRHLRISLSRDSMSDIRTAVWEWTGSDEANSESATSTE